MRRIQRKRAMTIFEAVVASSVTVLVVGGALGLMSRSGAGIVSGLAQTNSDATAQRVVRKLTDELAPAMSVVVDGDGNGLTYRLPQMNAQGAYTAPPVWDNVTRRIQRNGDGTITITAGAATRRVARNVLFTDPRNGNANYRLFRPGAGAVTRSLEVMVAVRNNGYQQRASNSRYREILFLRNIPELFR